MKIEGRGGGRLFTSTGLSFTEKTSETGSQVKGRINDRAQKRRIQGRGRRAKRTREGKRDVDDCSSYLLGISCVRETR